MVGLSRWFLTALLLCEPCAASFYSDRFTHITEYVKCTSKKDRLFLLCVSALSGSRNEPMTKCEGRASVECTCWKVVSHRLCDVTRVCVVQTLAEQSVDSRAQVKEQESCSTYWLCLDTRLLCREYDTFYAIGDVMSMSNADDCNNWRITIFKV